MGPGGAEAHQGRSSGLRRFLRRIAANRRLVVALQVAALLVLLGFLSYAVRDSWAEAGPLIRHADLTDLTLACMALGAYYLLFAVGWMWILRAYGIRLPYLIALQAEMVSMLAKYIPGGVWTPAARVVAVRRVGNVTDNSVVLASIALEAGLSAIAGVMVFAISLPTVESVEIPIWPLVAFAICVLFLLHPRVFAPAATRLFKPFGGSAIRPLPWRVAVALLLWYSFTWLVGGLALFFLLRSVGNVDPVSIAYLGGASCVGAIVAVLAVFAPSGLGVREGAMYTALTAITTSSVALATVALNRVAITLVEALLLGIGVVLWRLRGPTLQPPSPPPAPVPLPEEPTIRV